MALLSPRHTNNPGQPTLRMMQILCLLLLLVGTLYHCQPASLGPSDAGVERITQPDRDPPTPEQPKDEAHLGGVGGICNNNDSCQSPLVCETRIPGGYCTKGCTSSTQCPGKSACVKIKFNDGTAFLRCLRTCFTTADCRDGFYCYHPPGAWKLICLPDEAKPQP